VGDEARQIVAGRSPDVVGRKRAGEADAQSLLTTTDAKLLDVALASGLGSSSELNAMFRRITKTSPAELRRRIGRG